jgi:tetratricopeptide (TPR) repeat protein
VTRAAGILLATALVAGPASADTLPQLEQRSKAFYDVLERGDRERAAALFPDLERTLAAFLTDVGARLDKMRDDVTERDGDLEALYRSPQWREPEIASLVATYHLAWVRYQGAQLTGDAARKKALLKQAVDGFSQFTVVNEVPEIYAESLLGRGLAFMELGDWAKAREDLQTAAADSRTAAKAKAALAEVDRRAGGKKAPAPDDPEALLARLGDVLPHAAEDPAAEKDATALARGLAARGGTWPARVLSVVADKLGDAAHPRTSYGLFLAAQLAVDRSRCPDVAPLAAASAGLKDAGRSRHRPELLFLDAGCALNANRPREAADEFGVLLHEFPDAPRAREAAYYRFRALDLARASDPALAAQFDEALASYVARWPKAEGADEAHYLAAERARERGDCPRADAEYAQVGAGELATRARLGGLECRAGALKPSTPAAERAQLVADAQRFVHDVPPHGADELPVARAALLGAAVAAGGTPPEPATVVALLGDFETRYPKAHDLVARALALRLAARVDLGQLADASRDLDAYLRLPSDPDRRRLLSRLGRDLATRADHDAEAKPAALALARTVYSALAKETGAAEDRVALADVTLSAGDAAEARKLYEDIVQRDPASAEGLRGAARASAQAGDRSAALGYWRRVLDTSTPGGTAWYEARLAQVDLLTADGKTSDACQIVRTSRGRATTVGADQLDARLRSLEPTVCR